MRERGFTILELLVVIAIIGILASVTIASLSATRVKARDTRRMEDMHSLQLALAQYLITHAHFPIAAPTVLSGNDAVSLALVSAEVIPSVAADPSHPNFTYTYASDASGSIYEITFCLETNSIPGHASGCDNTIVP